MIETVDLSICYPLPIEKEVFQHERDDRMLVQKVVASGVELVCSVPSMDYDMLGASSIAVRDHNRSSQALDRKHQP